MKKKLFLLLTAVLFFTGNLYAYNVVTVDTMEDIEITFSPGYSIPMWDRYHYCAPEEDGIHGGISFTARSYFGKVSFGRMYEIDFGLETGYLPLYNWEYTDQNGLHKLNYSVIPIIGQIRYRFGSPQDNSYFYATTGAGIFLLNFSYECEYYTPTKTDSGITPGIGATAGYGYRMELGDNLHGDALIRWTSRYSAINLSFGLGMEF